MDRNAKIFSVDDMQYVALSLAQVTHKSVFRLGTNEKLRKVVEYIQAKPYDLALCDQAPADCPEPNLVPRIQDIDPDIPILFQNRIDNPKSNSRALKVGALDCLQKEPIDPRVVGRYLSSMIFDRHQN